MACVDNCCYKPQNSNTCLHYTMTNYEQGYNLLYNYQIFDNLDKGIKLNMSDELKQHLIDNKKNNQMSTCGNPYNLYTEGELEYIKQNRPISVNKMPTNEKRSMLTTQIFKSEDEVKETLEQFIGGDCSSVYTRDAQHQPVKDYYFHNWIECAELIENGKIKDINEYRHTDTYIKNHTVRQNLMDDASVLLKDINDGHTVCLSFGSSKFMDSYFQKIGNMYICNEVE